MPDAPALRPFQQRPLQALPEHPRLPHPFLGLPVREVEVPFSDAGPIRIRYRTFGSGPPLLLVHGLMTAGYSWRYALAPLGERWTLYVPDLPGAGDSDKPDAAYTPEATADWIVALQDALGIAGCPAIGNSMGGYLCMWAAQRHPGAFSRLVNLHSPGAPMARLYALRWAMSLPRAQDVLRRLIQRDPLWWAHKNVHYYDESLKSLEEARVYAAPLSDDAGARAFGRILRETMDPGAMQRFGADLRRRERYPIPLLLLYAERDPVVPPRVGRDLAALIPDAELVWLREASHFAHVDALERFLPPTLAFLGG